MSDTTRTSRTSRLVRGELIAWWIVFGTLVGSLVIMVGMWD